MHLQQFDVKTAFLYGEFDEIIYIEQPKGYEDGTDRVCKLNRSLYSLKQASRCWNHHFTEILKKHGLTSTSANYYVFTNENNKDRLILAIYIDDGLISATNQSSIKKLLAELRKEFEITSNGINTYLGLQIERLADGSIFLRQETYTKKILQRFRMENANAVAIPAEPSTIRGSV